MRKTIKIDCPVCVSRNVFVIGAVEKLSCDDCGFLFTENSQLLTGKCLICGSGSFYYFSPFGLSFLGRDSVCYVCEAHYRNVSMDEIVNRDLFVARCRTVTVEAKNNRIEV